MIRSKIKNNSAIGGSKPAVHTALSLTIIKITAFICRQTPGECRLYNLYGGRARDRTLYL